MNAGCQEHYKHSVPPLRSIDLFKLKAPDGTIETFIERINVRYSGGFALTAAFDTDEVFYRLRSDSTDQILRLQARLSVNAGYHVFCEQTLKERRLLRLQNICRRIRTCGFSGNALLGLRVSLCNAAMLFLLIPNTTQTRESDATISESWI